MCTEGIQDIIKIIEVGQDMILVIEVVMGIIQEVIQGMGGIIVVIIEEVVIENKITIEIGVGHKKDRTEMEEAVEVQVIVDQDQVQEQVQIEIGLDSNVGNMIILQGNVQLGKQGGSRTNKTNVQHG